MSDQCLPVCSLRLAPAPPKLHKTATVHARYWSKPRDVTIRQSCLSVRSSPHARDVVCLSPLTHTPTADKRYRLARSRWKLRQGLVDPEDSTPHNLNLRLPSASDPLRLSVDVFCGDPIVRRGDEVVVHGKERPTRQSNPKTDTATRIIDVAYTPSAQVADIMLVYTDAKRVRSSILR